MPSKTYGPLEVHETNEYDIESLQESKETKEKEPIVRGKFKVIDQLDQDHLKQQKLKKIQKYLCLVFFITIVFGVSGFIYIPAVSYCIGKVPGIKFSVI